MSTLQEQIAAAQAKAAGTQDTTGNDSTDSTEEGKLQEGFVEESLASASIAALSQKLADFEVYEPAVGDYKDIRLHSIIIGNGKKYTPNKQGYYVAAELPKEALEILAYHAKSGLVEETEE